MTNTLHILGSNSATPAHGRNQSAQLLQLEDEVILLDCGEGTQLQLKKYQLPGHKINRIFISHMHGDHYFGLPGLIFSFQLLRRKEPLYIYGPPGLKEILHAHFKYSGTALNFNLELIEWKPGMSSVLHESARYKVDCIPLSHRIPCMGFVFNTFALPELKLKGKNLPDWLMPEHFQLLKIGSDIQHPRSGKKYPNSYFTSAPDPPQRFAYITDTLPLAEHIPCYTAADLLYHEATFLHKEKVRSAHTFHTTTRQAATLAKQAGVKKLIIGHFSARYKELDEVLEEAKSIFPNTALATEGSKFKIA